VAAAAFVVACPYPALAIGANTGLQVSHLLILGFLAVAPLLKIRGDILAATVFVCGMTMPSAVMSGSLNSYVMSLFGWLMVPIGAYCWTLSRAAVIRGFSYALLLHAVVAAIQLVSFQRDTFPFPWLYINASFAPIDETAQAMFAVWTKRAFGYMPEPSSTIAALGTAWLLVVYAALRRPESWIRSSQDSALAMAASLAGVLLFAVGQSGAVPALLLLAIPVVWTATRASGRRAATPAQLVLAALTVAAIGLAVSLTGEGYGKRMLAEQNTAGSWDDRMGSIMFAIGLVPEMTFAEFLFGKGGRLADLAHAHTGSTGVHSVMVSHTVSTGFLGVLGLFSFALVAARRRTQATRTDPQLVRLCCSTFLFFSFLLVTGYAVLFSMWFVFGLLLCFNDEASVPMVRVRPLHSPS
jgi:hypothetical protein